ncbi:MAG TPA: hypothetical protein VEN81_12700 [Planctomycetota bacterium]|nr:hypothetical protein [Planctomycetota bacterium]
MPRSIAGILLVLGLGVAPAASRAQEPKDPKDLLRQIREAYYSLEDRGLVSFEASVKPDWRLVLKDQLASDPKAGEAAVQQLDQLRFVMSLDAASKVTVTHHGDPAPENKQAAAGYRQIFSGIDQTLSGFFQTWCPFVRTSPFPETGSKYRLEEIGDEYWLSYKDGSARVVTTVSKEFRIVDLRVTDKAFSSSLKPKFKKTAQGLLLVGYYAVYEEPGGENTTQLKVGIEYLEAGGLQLPAKLSIRGFYNDSPIVLDISFSGYDVKKK